MSEALMLEQERRVTDPRLDRIESNIEDIKKALVELVRLDANQGAYLHRLERVEMRQDAQAVEIRDLKTSDTANSGRLSNTERLVWLAVASGLGVFTVIRDGAPF